MIYLEDLNEADLTVSVEKVDNSKDILYLNISGRVYGYQSDEFSAQELADKFNSIAKHNGGKALNWIKKNSRCVSGSKKA